MTNGGVLGIGCLIMLVFIAIGLSLGAVCFDYSLHFLFGKDIHWAVDMVCGVLLSPINVTVAIVCFVLDVCGVDPPLFGVKTMQPAPAKPASVEAS